MDEQIIYRSIAIPLEGFEHLHAPHGGSENLDYLFVGRKDIIDKLVDLLSSTTRRGSYLITGYRGAGKTSVINKAIDKYRKGERGKKREALVVRINLGDNSELTPLNIYYSISTILRDQLVQEGFIYRLKVLPALRRINELIERMSFEISSARSGSLNHGFRNFGFSFKEDRNKKRLPINAREAEEILSQILQQVQGLNREDKGANRKIVFVLDEIDKLSDSEELSEIHYRRRTDVQELSKIARINTLLGSLKNFVTTADATFFFISGRETLDRYYSEKASSNSLYESLFDCVFEVPSFLTDTGERPRGTRLSSLMEEYVCRRLRPRRDDRAYIKNEDKDFLDYYTLKDYHKSLKSRLPLNQNVFRGINTLRSFIHYLTFHSWGNPKRLSSIFESFIVPRHQVMRNLERPNSILYLSEPGNDARHWLLFSANHQRSFSLASEITTLFQHQLSREVSKISDKLTVSALSSLHFILKLHSYGFTRESLHRMSEAINVHRSPELNTIIDDLLTHVFKSYIRRVRNGIFRYRFNSGFEQELRYISHVTELESATYNFSLDSMKHVKKFFEDILANSDSKDTGVISRSHITLGDMCAIEQSYTAASVHYSSASRILDSLLSEDRIPANQETLMQYIEAMIKQGDLEERRQNYNHAAAIYFHASRVIEDQCNKDENLQRHLYEGDSKWDLLKQPFWAMCFLSLKRSPSIKAIERPEYLYELNDPRFSYRAANLYFFDGKLDLAITSYSRVMTKSYDLQYPPSLRAKLKILLKGLSSPNERDAYLKGKAVVGIAETMLLQKSDELFNVYREKKRLPAEREQDERERYFADLLERYLPSSEPPSAFLRGIGANKYLDVSFEKAAEVFEQNQLYISAAITHIEAISYYTAILDVFDNSTFKDPERKKNLLNFNQETHKLILEKGLKAIRCIDKARQLETSQGAKTIELYDVHVDGTVESQKNITKLFDMLLGFSEKESYPVSEPVFWQNSLWAHKLAATLCWAHYVKRKIEKESHQYSSDENIPGSLPSILAVTGFSVRPGILLCWICARDWSRQYVEKKLTTLEGKGCEVNGILNNFLEPKSKCELTETGRQILDYITTPAEIRSKAGRGGIPDALEKAYMIARYLYFAHEFSRKISRKNLDLIFPRLPQLYFAQWKLLLNLISLMLVGNREITKKTSEQLASVRDFSLMLQRAFISLDQELVPEETVAPSHFDYEFIYLRLCESLETSISLVDRTSRAHKNIFQHKYFCHDDHSDPDFRMDYTLAYMFTPRARYLKREIEGTHSLLIKCTTSSSASPD